MYMYWQIIYKVAHLYVGLTLTNWIPEMIFLIYWTTWANQESYEGVMHLLYIWAQLLIKLSKQLHEKNILCQNLSFWYTGLLVVDPSGSGLLGLLAKIKVFVSTLTFDLGYGHCLGFVYCHCTGRWAVLDNTPVKIAVHSAKGSCTATTMALTSKKREVVVFLCWF